MLRQEEQQLHRMQRHMDSRLAIPGSASSLLPVGVAFLDPAEQIFEAMLAGWQTQQQSRRLRAETYKSRVKIVRRLRDYTNEYPWQWAPQDFEAFCASISGTLAYSTFRQYQNAIRLFNEYVTDARYQWIEECLSRFGSSPVQICDEWNTTHHRDDYEGRPERRPITYEELQKLFDFLDDRVDWIRAKKKKGALAAMRDAALIKTTYAWGLRRREVCRLTLADLGRNPGVKAFGKYGSIHVRFGKSVSGGPPRRRIVLTVPQFDWAIDTLEQYLTEVRPLFNPLGHPGIFVTERGGYVNTKYVDDRFKEIITEAGLPEETDFHCLRHSYATHLAEFGYDQAFITQQMGHSYAATTAIYTHISSDFKNRQIKQYLHSLYGDSK